MTTSQYGAPAGIGGAARPAFHDLEQHMSTDPQTAEPERLVKNLRDAQRRVRSTLIANADRLNVPFTDDPSKNPWDTFVRPAMRELQDAVRAACEELASKGAAPAVVPSAPVDRAAVLAEAIAELEAMTGEAYERALSEDEIGYANGLENATKELRRMADEEQQDTADRRVYAWAQTIDTADGGRTIRIPGIHHSGTGPETTAIVVSGEDVTVLAAMLAGEEQPEPEQACAHCGGDHAWDDCEAYTALVADEEQQPETQAAAEPAETECAHCWRLIENRGTPNMGGPQHDHWIHVPGGFTVCFPQRGADSPRAEPRAVDEDAPPKEPHPTEADLRHALAVLDRFHGRDTTAPAVVPQPGKEA